MADFYPSVRWIFVEKRVPAAYREVLAWLACVAVLVREVGGCFIEWSACGEAVGSSWRAAAEEELDALYRKRRSARLEKTSPAVALLYPRCAKGTLALRSVLARQGNPLSVFEHTTSRIPSLDSGGGNFRSSPPSSCTLFSSLIGPVTVGLLKRYITTPIQL